MNITTIFCHFNDLVFSVSHFYIASYWFVLTMTAFDATKHIYYYHNLLTNTHEHDHIILPFEMFLD